MSATSVSATPKTAAPPLASGYTDCRVCGSRLFYNRRRGDHVDDPAAGVCAECHDRPEARHLLAKKGNGASAPTIRASAPSPPIELKKPRAFNAAEKSLIRNVHSYMPAVQLLDVLNTRLVADLGLAAVPFTLEQLQAEVQQLIDPANAGDWAGLRDILVRARRCGLLGEITERIIDDFAVVFALSAAQHMHLRDVIRSAKEER
jgi:hypothetical protein